MSSNNNLYRSKKSRMLSGVCGGIGQKIGIDPTIIRLVWVVLSFFTAIFPGIILYIIFAIVIPEEPDFYDV